MTNNVMNFLFNIFLLSAVWQKYKALAVYLIIVLHCGIESSENIFKVQENFALVPFEIKSKIFFHTVNRHDDKIETLNNLFFVCKDWNDIIFNKRDKNQHVYKIHDLVHEYLCQRIENYKLNYCKKNKIYPDCNEIYNNHKDILFSPFARWDNQKNNCNSFFNILFDVLHNNRGYLRSDMSISVDEFTNLVKKVSIGKKFKFYLFIKEIMGHYFWQERLEILINVSDNTALLKKIYEFLEKNAGRFFAKKSIEELLTDIFRSSWQSDVNVINKKTTKALEYYFKKIYGHIKGNSILQNLHNKDKEARLSVGIFTNKLIYLYFTHADTIEKMIVRQHENNCYLIKQINKAGISNQKYNTSEVNNLLQRVLKHQKERINGKVIKFMRSIIHYRDYLKKMISNTPVEFFLIFEDPCAIFNQLYSLDDVYAKQFFVLWFKQVIERYYKNNAIDIMLLRSMFLRSTVFPCPLFSMDEKGKTIYDHLKNIHQDFAKKDIYKHYALCGNIALGALRQYFSTMTKKDFQCSKNNLKNIRDDIVKIVEYRVDHLCHNSSLEYPIQDLLCEYDQDFGNEIFSLFFKEKYCRSFSKEELEINPLRYRYNMAQFGPSCRIDIGLNFFDVNLLYQIIMNLCGQKKEKEAKRILKTWQKDQPEKINEFLMLLLGDPEKIKQSVSRHIFLENVAKWHIVLGIAYKAAALSEQAKQKKFNIYFNFLTKSWLCLMLGFSFFSLIFDKIRTQSNRIT